MRLIRVSCVKYYVSGTVYRQSEITKGSILAGLGGKRFRKIKI